MIIHALLTGKKNSTFKNKNIIRINKQRIFLYPAKAASDVKSISAYFTSSDSDLMLKSTKKLGYSPIKRPKTLSKKNSLHRDVIIHALKYIKKKTNVNPDYLLVLLANSLTIKKKWIETAIKIIKNKKVDAVVPVYKNNDHHPIRSKKIKNNFLSPFIKVKKNTSTNRQDLEPCYFLAHNFWLIRTECILKNNGQMPWSFMGNKVVPIIIKDSIDIHFKEDILLSRKWILNNKDYLD